MVTNVEQKSTESSLNIIDDLSIVDNANKIGLGTALNQTKTMEHKDGDPTSDLVKQIIKDFKNKLNRNDNDDKTIVEIGVNSVEEVLRFVLKDLPPEMLKEYINTDEMAEALINGLHTVSKGISNGIKELAPEDLKRIGRDVRDRYLSATKGEIKRDIKDATNDIKEDVKEYLKNDLPQDAKDLYDNAMSTLEQGYNDTVEALQTAQEGISNAMNAAKKQYHNAKESVSNFFGSMFK